MRLALTGGGTGGHIFPALEVGFEVQRRGWDVHYFGSLRGQEGELCKATGVPFTGFRSFPFYSFFSYKGFKARVFFVKATLEAQIALSRFSPDVLFTTGGYSSAPVVAAAKRLKIPYVIHEQNSYPGRTNVILSKDAFAVTTFFEDSEQFFPEARVVRTGMPVRAELREKALKRELHGKKEGRKTILVMGGSQGAAVLNDLAIATGLRMTHVPVDWVHITGKLHFESKASTLERFGLSSSYQLKSFAGTHELADILAECDFAIARSGAGTIADLAAFRIPAIYIPYPHAFGDHQFKNAQEIDSIGACSVIREESLTPGDLENLIEQWLNDDEKMQNAQKALAAWDRKDAVEQVISILEQAIE